jgi:membrane protease subunit (stomatin/prohibitin family)
LGALRLMERLRDRHIFMATERGKTLERCFDFVQNVVRQAVAELERDGSGGAGAVCCQQQGMDIIHHMVPQVRTMDQGIDMDAQQETTLRVRNLDGFHIAQGKRMRDCAVMIVE